MEHQTKFGYLGVGRQLPSVELTNEDLAKIVDTSDEWITQRTGIKRRRILGQGETLVWMAVSAARNAIEHSHIDPEKIKYIRIGVNTHYGFPSLGTIVQRELGLKNVCATDLSAGCSGFIFGVEDVYNRLQLDAIQFGEKNYGLVVGGDALSTITDWQDRSTCVLFGDGFGAAVIGPVKSGEILATYTRTQGRYTDLLYLDSFMKPSLKDPVTKEMHNYTETNYPFLRMSGTKVFPVAVRTMMADIRSVVEKHNRRGDEKVALEDIAYVIPHQANLRIVKAVQEGLKLREDQVYRDGVINFGNVSAGTIPIAYVDQWNKRPGALEVDVAFGAGFASGAILRRVAE